MMLKPYDPSPNDNEPAPECRTTVDLIQRTLDGEAVPESLDADTHATACSACRERVRAARVLLSVLTAPREPVAVPPNFADRVMSAMWTERHTRTRRRTYAGLCAALAAGLLLAIAGEYFFSPKQEVVENIPSPLLLEPVKPSEAPPPREKAPAPAHEPRPIRIGDELAKAGESFLEAQKPLADSVAVAPKLFESIPNPFKMTAPQPDPMATALEPARKSLTELPLAARVGLEPVTGTAEKAFKRFLSDVGAVKPNS